MESLKLAFDIILSPFKGFNSLKEKEKKSFLLPLFLTLLLMGGAMGYYSFNADMKYIITKQLEDTGAIEKIPHKSRDQIINLQAKASKYAMPIGAIVSSAVYILIISLYLFIMAKMYTSDLSFKEAMAIVGNSYFVFFLWSIIFLVILFIVDFKTVSIQNLMPTNLGYFFSPEQVGKKLYVFLSKIDIFSLWFVSLLGIGFSVFTEETLKKSLLTVFVPYIVLILLTVLLV